ncbi:MAG TPA: MFS transporter [Acidobacteriaceae bacterium]|jgi:MFS family permease|nr:MFS transporter [Acidobacteriaceae bacterium]
MNPEALAAPLGPPATHRRWGIAWLLGLGVLINYLDRVNISVAQQALHHSFGISTVTYGYLLGAYSWTYALLQLPSGVLLDKFGLRRVGVASAFLWSAACFAGAAAIGTVSLFLSRLVLGVGEASTFPLNAKAVGEWFPEHERSLPTAMFDGAAKFSPAIGVPVMGLLLLHFGWRFTFVFTGAISLVFFLLFFLLYRNPADDPHLSASERAYIEADLPHAEAKEQAASASLGYLMRQKKILGLCIGFAAYNYSFYLMLTWLPSYLATGLHMTAVHAVLAASIPWFFAGTVELLLGGWLVDALIRRGHDSSRVRQTTLVLGMVCGLGIVGPALTHSPALVLLAFSIGLGGLSVAAPVGWSIPALLAPPNSTGRVGGILNFANQASAISAPVITGYLTAWTHGFAAAFLVAGFVLLVGIAGYVLLLGRIERVPTPVL